MSKQNKYGWIRHRGGKCPVDDYAHIEFRMRNGQTSSTQTGGLLNWEHGKWVSDIMAYRIHKPAEQPDRAAIVVELQEQCAGLVDSANSLQPDGPLQWRDRITEIDRTVEALEEERVSLVQLLEGVGFRLIERINAGIADAMKAHEDMSDWRNWKVGDLILVNGDEYAADGVFMISNFDFDTDTTMPVYLDECGWPEIECMKFHSRPSK